MKKIVTVDKKYMNKSPYIGKPDEPNKNKNKLDLINLNMPFLPILDDKKFLVEVLISSKESALIDTALILAGGKGSRSNWRYHGSQRFDSWVTPKLNIEKKLIFPDHYKFTKSEFIDIANEAKDRKYQIIMTEKDYFKIKDFNIDNIKYLKISLKIDQKEKFIKQLVKDEKLVIDQEGINKGLLNSIEDLDLSNHELNKLCPKVVDFYQNTANYNLLLKAK